MHFIADTDTDKNILKRYSIADADTAVLCCFEVATYQIINNFGHNFYFAADTDTDTEKYSFQIVSAMNRRLKNYQYQYWKAKT